MNLDDAAERRRLEAAAFRRGASQSDLDALNRFDLERQTSRDVIVEDAAPDVEPIPQPEPEPEPVALDIQKWWTSARRMIAVACVSAAVAAGCLAGWALAPRAQASALSAFASPPTEETTLMFVADNGVDVLIQPGMTVSFDQRLLDEINGEKFFIATGALNTATTENDPSWTTAVCFSVEVSDGSGSGNCVSLHDFETVGVTVRAPSPSALAPGYKLGPTGGVELLDTKALLTSEAEYGGRYPISSLDAASDGRSRGRG